MQNSTNYLNMRYYGYMKGKTTIRSINSSALTGFLFCMVAFFAAGCLQTGHTLQGGGVIFDVYDQPASESEPEPVITPGPYTFTDLRYILSAFGGDASLAVIGGYPSDRLNHELLFSAIEALEEEGFQVGFLMMDIATGYGVAYNADAEFYSASSIKAPYVVSLVAGWPEIIEYWSWSLDAIIEYSDNDEYFWLRSIFGDDLYIQWCEDSGVDTTFCDEWFPMISTRTLAKLWLSNYEYFQSESEGVDEVVSWFRETANSAIFYTLGFYYTVNTKAGWIDDEEFAATVDAGIVYAEDNPYLLVIMTDVPDNTALLDPFVWALSVIHDDMVRAMEHWG